MTELFDVHCIVFYQSDPKLHLTKVHPSLSFIYEATYLAAGINDKSFM